MANTRKNPSKRLRFEVFKRDYFTCQYCGSQPPDVVLHCDHVNPVALGGQTTIDNLITACESCNQGKAAKPLGDRQIRPDATLLYLQAQQEIAELIQLHEEEALKAKAMDEFIDSLSDICLELSEEMWIPIPATIHKLTARFPLRLVAEACKVVAQNVAKRRVRCNDYHTEPYLWGVAKRMHERGDFQ